MFSSRITKLEKETLGIIFNIERYHIHDGEGVRTNVFLKGCNLHCPWCCNPESQNLEPEIALHKKLCTKCYTCVHACPNGCCIINSDGDVEINHENCVKCGTCVQKCPSGALELYGREMSVAEVIAEVEKDEHYYINSDGGVTLSGGEACLQPIFAREIIMACRRRYIHTAIETAAAIPWEQFWSVVEHVDEVLLDIKTTVDEQFKKISRVPLAIVNQNLARLREKGKNVTVRCPIVSTFNDNNEHIDGVIQWAKEFDIKDIDLLPFHQLGRYKYQSLGREYQMNDIPEMDRSIVEKMAQGIREQGFNVTVGG